MMIDDAALNALEAKARAATPGPWHWNMNSRQLCSRQAGITLFRDVEWWNGKIAEDAAYIAALDPVVAVALIARIRELEAALAPFANKGRALSASYLPDSAMWDTTVGNLREAARISKGAHWAPSGATSVDGLNAAARDGRRA